MSEEKPSRFMRGGLVAQQILAAVNSAAGEHLPPPPPDPAPKSRTVVAVAGVEVNDFNQDVRDVLDEVAFVLASKNAAYGDSALNPVRIFSKADSQEQIRVRIDDKLSRLARGSDAGEDVTMDLLGYLVLLRVVQKRGAE